MNIELNKDKVMSLKPEEVASKLTVSGIAILETIVDRVGESRTRGEWRNLTGLDKASFNDGFKRLIDSEILTPRVNQ